MEWGNLMVVCTYITMIRNGSIRIKGPVFKEIVRQSGYNNFTDIDGMITVKQDQICLFFEAIIGEQLDETMLKSILKILAMEYTQEHVVTIMSSEKVSTFLATVTNSPLHLIGFILMPTANNNGWNTKHYYAIDPVVTMMHGRKFANKEKLKNIGKTLTSSIVSCYYSIEGVPNISAGSEIEFDTIPAIIRYPEIENAESPNKLIFDIIDVFEEEWHKVTIDMDKVRDFNTWQKVVESFTSYTLKPLPTEQNSEFQQMISHTILANVYKNKDMTSIVNFKEIRGDSVLTSDSDAVC
jgi:hypothetical protein